MPSPAIRSNDSEIAKAFLSRRLEGLRTEAAMLHGRMEELTRLIGELDTDLPTMPAFMRPPVAPVSSPVRLERKTRSALRAMILGVVRSSRTRGLRLSEIREALAEKGFTTHSSYISNLLNTEKQAGRIIHNPHTGRHRWAGHAVTLTGAPTPDPEPDPEPDTPEPEYAAPPMDEVPTGRHAGHWAKGSYGPNRQAIRTVLSEAHGGMTRATIQQACAERGAAMDTNLLGVTIMAERRLGHIRFDEPTHTYHWTGKDEANR